MKQDILRNQVKIVKATEDIMYKDLAEYLEIHTNSFYNWLKGYYDLSYEKAKSLESLITDMLD